MGQARSAAFDPHPNHLQQEKQWLIFLTSLNLILLVLVVAELLHFRFIAMNPSWALPIAASISAVAGSLSAFFAFMSIRNSWKQATRSLSTQILIHFQTRYDDLVNKRAHELRTDKQQQYESKSGLAFFRAYWLLQLEQFHAYRQGYIDDEVYTLWLKERAVDVDMEPVCTVSFGKGWEHALGNLPIGEDDPFIKVMGLIFNVNKNGKAELAGGTQVAAAERINAALAEAREHQITVARRDPSLRQRF